MLAVGYLILMVALGDAIARPFFGYVSRPQRLATAFPVGLLVSTWLTYLVALVFSGVEQPLIAADAIVAWLMVLVLAMRAVPAWQRSRATGRSPLDLRGWTSVPPAERWDWVLIAAIGAFVAWMMVSTFNVGDGRLNIAVPLWSDFGPTTAIAQSFAVGHNYPTQYPHFAGPSILYHFLFYFQVGNLTFLGLDPATANNVLSIGALTAMLALVMALGVRLFHSAATGRIAAILFFFHGALSFVPFLAAFASPADALDGITTLDHYLASGFPYRGEEWGIWTQNVFLNQRHLSTAIGIVLIALLFVVDRLQLRAGARPDGKLASSEGGLDPSDPVADPSPDPIGDTIASISSTLPAARFTAAARDRLAHPVDHLRAGLRDPALPGYVATGLLLGLLPLLNSPMFIASAALFGVIFVVFPNRVQMAALAVAAAIPAIPQILFLRPADLPGTSDYPALHWGYVVDPPTLVNVAAYLAFIFGLKLILTAVGLVGANSLQRRIFLAACSLVAVAFLVQFSVEVFANHKFLNAWLIIANVFAAYGLLRLWGPRPDAAASIASLTWRAARRWLAVVLAAVIVFSGLIDLVPIVRVQRLSFPLAGDRLYDWVAKETRTTDVFLTDIFVTSPILLAGRAIYYGWPYYAWSAGYDTNRRQELYVRMLQSRDPGEVLQLLQANRIAYVAIDDGLRNSTMAPDLNEDLYRASFKVVFDDPDGAYAHMTIYQVPASTASPTTPAASGPSPVPRAGPPEDMFVAGSGADSGRFASPRGIAVDTSGNVLVADTDNHLVERFSADGKLLSAFGGLGDGPGQFHAPSGVGVDSRGHIFVADTGNSRLVELDEHDRFVRDWHGPDPGFYGTRDIAVGSDDAVYILDQGRARVVKLSPDGTVISFGSFGDGPAQLADPWGLAVGAGFVFVADTTNGRIQVWDTAGRFVRSQPIPEWKGKFVYGDVLTSADGRLLYASSPQTNEVLVFAIDGTRKDSLRAALPEQLDQPAAMALTGDGNILVIDFGGARVSLLETNPH